MDGEEKAEVRDNRVEISVARTPYFVFDRIIFVSCSSHFGVGGRFPSPASPAPFPKCAKRGLVRLVA